MATAPSTTASTCSALASASALWPFSSSEKQDPPTPHPDAVPVAQQTALPRLSNYDAVDEAFAEGGALVDEGACVGFVVGRNDGAVIGIAVGE